MGSFSRCTKRTNGVLRIGFNVNMITSEILDIRESDKEFPKIPGVTLKIHVDEEVISGIKQKSYCNEADVEEVRFCGQNKLLILNDWLSVILSRKES